MAKSYSDKQVREAALLFLTHGNRQKVCDITGIPHSTLSDWITGEKKGERWQIALKLATKEADSDRQALWQSILKASGDKMIERIETGDPIVKDGEVVGYKPVALRDIAWTHGVITDKVRVAEGKPTSITGKSADQLQELAKLFDKMTSKNKQDSDNQLTNKDQATSVNQSTKADQSITSMGANKHKSAGIKKELH